MKLIIILLSAFCFYFGKADTDIVDYYWRDYTGNVPEDALEAGLDIHNNPIYIGQACFRNAYLQVVRIYPKNKEVIASYKGIHKTSSGIKILCTRHAQRFKWLPVDGKTLQVTTIGKHLVVGGSEVGDILSIGRIMYQRELIIGKVCSYTVGNAKLYFPYGNSERSSLMYEILVYEKNDNVSLLNPQ